MTTLQQQHQEQRRKRAIEHRRQMVDSSNKATDKLITTKAPIAYGYGRVSHDCQVDGESVDAQGDRVHKIYELELADQHVEWGGFFQEPGSVSASKNDFCDRPTGKILTKLMRPGDYLIVDKVDRLWRSLHDFSRLMTWFKERQITVYFANMSGCSVSMDTPMGDFLLGVFVLIAQLEANTISERTKRALEYGMQQGYWKYSATPLGCKLLGKKPKRTLEWDWEVRADMAKIVELREQEGLGFNTIEKRMDALYQQRSGVPNSPHSPWTYQLCCKGYKHEKMFRLFENPMQVDYKLLKCLKTADAATLNTPEDAIALDEKYRHDRRRR